VKVFLAEGEVLLQTPAQWLGGTIHLAPPRRIAAPAELTGADIHSIRALGGAKILIEEAPGPLAQLKAAWDDLRFGWLRLPRLSRK
jgi:hypothetical protein